jgi:8-oxo-dGTP pyrophosphatase MutT (NUDIX family)
MKFVALVGTGIFWALWPVWYVYFKLQPERSRVLVVVGDQVLLIKGWISDGKYGLPGGGKKKDEAMEHSAVRELEEETGIQLPESALRYLGKANLIQNGLPLRLKWYELRLDQKPKLHLQPLEIIEACWAPIDLIDSPDYGPDIKLGLKLYKPLEQSSLL